MKQFKIDSPQLILADYMQIVNNFDDGLFNTQTHAHVEWNWEMKINKELR